jgi:hypothetical protein
MIKPGQLALSGRSHKDAERVPGRVGVDKQRLDLVVRSIAEESSAKS